MSERVLDLLKKVGVAQHGDFVLSSGRRSSLYVDCRRATLDKYVLPRLCYHMFHTLYAAAEFDAVGGPSIGADPIVAGMLCYDIGPSKGFLVRKEAKGHGLKKMIEGPVEPGMRVAIVEDVTTTGQSVKIAVEAAKDFGLEVVVVGTVVDRSHGEARKLFDVPFIAMTTEEDLS